jgi:hypothetical protein
MDGAKRRLACARFQPVNDIRTVQIGVVHPLAAGDSAQQRALPLRPGEYVAVVFAHATSEIVAVLA